MGLEVGALEVGLLATGEVAHVVAPAGEVGLRGTAPYSGHVDRCRRQGEELSAAQCDHRLRGRGHRRHHEHDSALQ